MEPPPCLLGRSAIPTILHVSIIVCWTLLHEHKTQMIKVLDADREPHFENFKTEQTFAGELDNMDRMLMQTELTVIAGDHDSYKISVRIADSGQEFLNKLLK